MNTNSAKANSMEIVNDICLRQRKFEKDSLTFAMNEFRSFIITGNYQNSTNFRCIIAQAMPSDMVDGKLVEVSGKVYYRRFNGRNVEMKDWESLTSLFDLQKIVIRNTKTGQILHIFSLDRERITYMTLEENGEFVDCSLIYYKEKEERLVICKSIYGKLAAPPKLDFYDTQKTYDTLLSLAGRVANEKAFINAIKGQNFLNVILCLVFKQSKEYTHDKDGKSVVQYAEEYANPEIEKLIHRYYIE